MGDGSWRQIGPQLNLPILFEAQFKQSMQSRKSVRRLTCNCRLSTTALVYIVASTHLRFLLPQC
eukprot:COSAG02_NODE_124_length_35047_cov_31.554179_38_plen_64_part_00